MNNQVPKGSTRGTRQERRTRPRSAALRRLIEERWSRLSWDRSDKEVRKRLLAGSLEHVTLSLRAPWSSERLVREICRLAQIPIQFLSPELGAKVHFRGKTIFGIAGDEIEKVCWNYDGLHWWFSEAGLTVDKITWPPAEDFDTIAGQIIYEMRQAQPAEKYFSKEQHLRIATQLDEFKKFTPLQVLPKQWREELRGWNQKYGKHAITTFRQAVDSLQPRFLSEQILRRFYRAGSTYKRRRKLL